MISPAQPPDLFWMLLACTWNSYGNQVAGIVAQPLMGEARVRSNHSESERFYSLAAAVACAIHPFKRLSISAGRRTPILYKYTYETPTTLTPIDSFHWFAQRSGGPFDERNALIT